MKQYRDLLLLEFLMFSKDIEKEIQDFKATLLEIDNQTIYELIERIETENIYTKYNIDNLKKVIKFLKDKLGKYEEVMGTLECAKPSYDIYYYEYLEKYEVLKNNKKIGFKAVPVPFLEDSIRFDFYAFTALISSSKDYVEQYMSCLTNNSLFPLFVNKLLNEQPDSLLIPTILNRICSILKLNIASIENQEVITYLENLIKKVKFFAKNKKATVFDYELFEYYHDKAFFEFLITNDVSFTKFHDYIVSEHFLSFLEEYVASFDNPDRSKLFLYNSNMKIKFKKIIFYILGETNQNEIKIRCNVLLQKWLSHKVEDEELFYKNESIKKSSFKEVLVYSTDDKLLINEMKSSLGYDYYILEIYTLNDLNFLKIIPQIDSEFYIMWLRKMLDENKNFFRNEMLRKRTIQILTLFEYGDKEFAKQSEKMKRKIIKLSKGLE